MRTALYSAWLSRCLFRSPVIWGLLIVAMVMASLPLMEPAAMFAGLSYEENRAQSQSNVAMMHESFDSPSFQESAPKGVRDLVGQELGTLEEAVASSSPREYFTYMCEYVRAKIESHEVGVLVGPTGWGLEAELRFYQAIVQLDNPMVYGSTVEMPGLMYVSFVFARGATVVWTTLPVIAMLLLFVATARGRLLGSAPVSRAAASFLLWGISVVVGMLGLLAAFLPGFLVSAIRNGVGDLLYPIVFTMNDQTVQLTLIELLGHQAVLYVLTCTFLSAAMLLVRELTRSPVVAAIAALALSAAPLMDGYMDAAGITSESAALLAILPTTYLDFASVAGYPLFFFAQQISSVEGVTLGRGLLLLGGCSAGLVAASQAVRALREFVGARARRVRHARA